MEDMVRLNPEKKLLVAVVHSLQEPWVTITREGQNETWLRNIPNNVDVVHFHSTDNSRKVKCIDKFNEYLRWRAGGRVSRVRNLLNKVLLRPLRRWVPKYSKSSPKSFGQISNVYRVHCWDMYATLRWKRLAVMRYFLHETNFEFLLITSSSSYLRPHILLGKLAELDQDFVYAGPVIGDSRTRFVSGAQTLLNRKTATFIIENRSKIPVELLDDIGLGVFCSEFDIQPTPLSTLNISSLNELDAYSRDELTNYHHFRLKAELNGQRQDVAIFLRLKDVLDEE